LWVEKCLAERQKSAGKARSGEKTDRRISNIVFMGMGEPLLNYDRVLKAVRILNRKEGYFLGIRHFTLSTAGIVPGILKLEKENAQIRLAVSLHTADQKTREEWMPVAKKYGLDELINALRSYQNSTGRRITFEYIPIEGVNMSEGDVKLLSLKLAGLNYNLNVIAYNEVEGSGAKAPSDEALRRFSALLKQNRVPFVFRKSKGRDLKAACGQLGLYWKNLHH
jgi:23S rRNA (adenine2503-C2)-methyltransferase